MRAPAAVELDRGRGWALVAGAFAANFTTFGLLFSFGVFLTPVAESFGTTTGPVATVFSVTVFVYYLAGALGGMLAARVGVRAVVGFGGALFSAALLVSARVPSLGWLYPLFAVPVGIGIGGCYSPMVGAVGGWFERRRTLAIGLVLAGVGTGTLVMPIVARLLIDAAGWRGALTAIGIGGGVLLAGATAASSEPPGRVATGRPRLRAAVSSPLFRRMYVSVLLVSPGFYAPLAFLNDYAVDRGHRPALAAALVSVIGGASVVARLVFAAVGDRIGAVRQYRASYAGMLAANVVWFLAGGSLGLLLLAAVLHGVGWAAWVTAGPSVFAQAFDVADLGAVLGTFYTALGVGGLFGPAVAGFLIDGPGYQAAVAFAVMATAAATAVLLTAPSASPAPR